VVGPIRSELAAIDPDLPLYGIRTLQDIVDDSVARPRFNSALLGLFAGLAMLLAVIGVYGLISYSVAQRLREIGVRIALGASRSDIMQLVLRQGLAPVVAGVLFGLGLALASTRLLAALLYQVSPTDPPTYTVVTILLLATSAVACVVPAIRATRVEPIAVLREE
jgi:putative ABC transport system permease protein